MSQTVLYVEDNPDNRLLISMYFKKSDYNLDLAGTGQEALDKISEVVYDAIVLDLNLDGEISGTEFMRRMREDERYSDIPLVIVSGLPNLNHVKEVKKEWYQTFMSKPFRKQELFGALDVLLKNPRD